MYFGLTIPQVEVIPGLRMVEISRHQFGDDPVQLMIGGSQYFVFSSNSARQCDDGNMAASGMNWRRFLGLGETSGGSVYGRHSFGAPGSGDGRSC